MTKTQKIFAMAMMLLATNGKTTTLEVKAACRLRYGTTEQFNQDEISSLLDTDYAKPYSDPTKVILDLDFVTIRNAKGTPHREYMMGKSTLNVTQGNQAAPKTVAATPQSTKVYTVTDEDGCTISGTKVQMDAKIARGLPYYHSKSKDEYIHLDSANAVHLMNIVALGLSQAHGNQSSVKDFVCSPQMAAFVARYQEITDAITVAV